MQRTGATRVLIVSTFVLPHLGGVEMFAAWARKELEEQGLSVRTLSAEYPEAEAEATVPVWTLFGGRWPLPRGGLGTVWREVGQSDVVLANAHHYLLPLLAIALARLRRRPVIFVLHGADDSMAETPRRLRLVKLWNWWLARPLLKLTTPVALSEVGREYASVELGVEAEMLPYPLAADLPTARAQAPSSDEPLRVVWAGRLVPEKDPLAAVAAVEHLREERAALLDVFGDGPLLAQLRALAAERPWLRLHGLRPWVEVVAAMAESHAVLATSKVDNVYVAALEALAIGAPTVSTAVGEVPVYYDEELSRFCVVGGEREELGLALAALAGGWAGWQEEFARNGARLRARHVAGGAILVRLVLAKARRTS